MITSFRFVGQGLIKKQGNRRFSPTQLCLTLGPPTVLSVGLSFPAHFSWSRNTGQKVVLGNFPLVRIFTFFPRLIFFPVPLLSRNYYFRPETLSFPSLNSPYEEAQHMITLQIVNFISCSFITWRIQDVLHLLKFYQNLSAAYTGCS